MIDLFKRFKKSTVVDDYEIDAATARANNQIWKDGLKLNQEEYKKRIIEEIKSESLKGKRKVYSLNKYEEYITDEFLDELKAYFESKDFIVEEFQTYNDDRNKRRLIISW